MFKRRLSSRQAPIISILILAALTLLFFYKLAFTGMILGRGDVYSYFYPYWSVRSAAFRAGHIPLWSPDIFMGAPLLANSQLGTFYPPNWLVTPLSTPDAMTVSLLVHIFWAMLGVYTLSRRVVNLDHVPAIVAGVLFGVGGYLSGQIEHINQLQALSWMPWLLVLFDRCRVVTRLRWGHILLFAVAFALQLLAGHPQTVFITLVGLSLYGLSLALSPLLRRKRQMHDRDNLRPTLLRITLVFISAGAIALILASPQLIPMLELARQSNRSGGLVLHQAMAFSLNPYLIGRGLLPSYDGLIFGEYMAYSGVIGLGLAILGAFSRWSMNLREATSSSHITHHTSRPLPWLVLVAIGFLFALGVYNPLYWTLASLPGFSFFRVPARWLSLVALSVAVLAGVGLQSLKTVRPRGWIYAVMIAAIGALVAASFLADRMAVDVTGPAVPTTRTLIGWGAAFAILFGGTFFARIRFILPFLACAAVAELFFASQILPYNELVPPDVYTASRFTIRQLQAYGQDQTPPGRILSITPLQFDPGDVDALKSRYAALGMSDLAVRIALVDTKLREVIAPNLSLEWGIPSIDGFDGGLLPTDNYSQFTSLLLPPGQEPTTDGRLREMLAQPECRGACIPDQRWLNLTNTQYLITDKVGDFWQDGVAYDTQFEITIPPGFTLKSAVDDPNFIANAVDVLYKGDALLRLQMGRQTLPASPLPRLDPLSTPGLEGYQLVRYTLDTPQTIHELSLDSESTAQIRAVTLVDTRVSEVFQQLTIGAWRRVLSSDIKLYHNQTVQPRAFVIYNLQVVLDDAAGTKAALNIMRDTSFDPSVAAVIAGSDIRSLDDRLNPDMSSQITVYTPERVEIQVNTSAEGLLVLTDAFYPGWVVTVNGEPATIYRTDIMFRGVKVPAGESTVVFEYRPWWWPGILILGGLAWAAALLALVIFRRRSTISASSKSTGRV